MAFKPRPTTRRIEAWDAAIDGQSLIGYAGLANYDMMSEPGTTRLRRLNSACRAYIRSRSARDPRRGRIAKAFDSVLSVPSASRTPHRSDNGFVRTQGSPEAPLPMSGETAAQCCTTVSARTAQPRLRRTRQLPRRRGVARRAYEVAGQRVTNAGLATEEGTAWRTCARYWASGRWLGERHIRDPRSRRTGYLAGGSTGLGRRKR